MKERQLEASCIAQFGRIHLERSEHTAALERYNEALTLLQSIKAKPEIMRLHKELAEAYKRMGRFDLALEHHEHFHATELEIKNEQAENRAQLLSIRMGLEKAQHEAELKSREAEAERRRSEELEALVLQRTQQLEDSQLEMLDRLARAAEFRDEDTGHHTKRVGEWSAAVAAELGDMTATEIAWLRQAARLHDIGKIAVPDGILLKPGKLTAEEFDVIKSHTTQGAELLKDGHSPLLEMAHVIALTHHERFDGTGYPRGLKGEAIPLIGRIVAVVDVFDALTSERKYKRPWSAGAALAEIRDLAGKQFDPRVVKAFMAFYERTQMPQQQALEALIDEAEMVEMGVMKPSPVVAATN